MQNNNLPEILIISSYPPRECGIATYSQDLLQALQTQFNQSFKVTVCAVENEYEKHHYNQDVDYVLDSSDAHSYHKLAFSDINANVAIKLVLIQHEFGFFVNQKPALLHLIQSIQVPVIITFHTVLPNPNVGLKLHIQYLAFAVQSIIVMTQHAAQILQNEYHIDAHKITVIAHGTHLVKHVSPELLKEKYGFEGRSVLSTFGLISSGKSIETTLRALPAIIKKHPNVLFLAIGKTHPTVMKHEGELYRNSLEQIVKELNLQQHVKFVNYYLPLKTLLEYLQLTTIYLFTSKDPHQAVSGTFAYAISCGCPIVSTPIPHAREVLLNDTGILIDFENVNQLQDAVIRLLDNTTLGEEMRLNGMHRMASTAWENTAIAHALLFEKYANDGIFLRYSLPEINLKHVNNLTTDFGMIQFSKINRPDLESGYTVDDNARALIAICMQYEITQAPKDLDLIHTYFSFIKFCMQSNGRFLNYVDSEHQFTEQNSENNLDDANGRVIWALGYLISATNMLPAYLVEDATQLLDRALLNIPSIHSTRAIAFTLKGLYYYDRVSPTHKNKVLASILAHRLERMFEHESGQGWDWFESYLTYANAVLPEGMLCAYQITGESLFKDVAKKAINFLIHTTFGCTTIKPISNKSWKHKNGITASFGEQPIDVSYTILALDRFYEVFYDELYLKKVFTAFTWFLGNNHLHQIVYNPRTGGCYDGLEEHHVNLNQGAESTLSYLMARLIINKHENEYIISEMVEQEHAYM
jgi:glycosyltransferase involved in cell wall biosynthesis